MSYASTFFFDQKKTAALPKGSPTSRTSSDETWTPIGGRLQSYLAPPRDLATCDAVVIWCRRRDPLASPNRRPQLYARRGDALSQVLQQGQLVVLESDHLPARPASSGADPRGVGMKSSAVTSHLAFSPEHGSIQGEPTTTVRTTPKLVGGLTDVCTERRPRSLRGDLPRRPS